MADTATAATTAAATKKKYRNKNKKSQQQQQQQQKTDVELAQGAAAVKDAAVHQANGHIQAAGDAADDADVALINGIMQQVQLCNGHVKDKAKGKAKAESVVEMPTVTATLNGHVNKSAAINNNNHINNNNNSNNINNNVSNNTSSRNKNNNNNNSNSSGNRSSKAKNNNKSQSADEKIAESAELQTLPLSVAESAPVETQEEHEEEQQTTSVMGANVVATSKSTANTQTTSATTTKTTAMAIATRGSPEDEAPSTSAAAAAAAAQPQAQSQPQPQQQQQPQPQQSQLQLEPAISADEIIYKEYEAEHQMHDIMRLIQAELSEPYSIYTYRYFIYNWPKLCFLASHDNQYVGAIVCKLDMHMNVRRGYIAMLAVRKEYRKLKIGTTLVTKAIEAMLADNADEVVLETEMRNEPALRLYENLGFVRDKRLFRYYLNGVDALRLKLWFR